MQREEIGKQWFIIKKIGKLKQSNIPFGFSMLLSLFLWLTPMINSNLLVLILKLIEFSHQY